MPSPAYTRARHLLPVQAGTDPDGLWGSLAGPDVTRHERPGYAAIVVAFPPPAAQGEPYFAVFVRRPDEAVVHAYVVERGLPSPNPLDPVAVTLAKWTMQDAEHGLRVNLGPVRGPTLADCFARLDREVLALPPPESAEPAGLARDKLVPRLRHPAWAGWDELPSRALLDLPIAGLPRVACGVDSKQRFQFVQHADLAGDTTLASLEAIAVANLARRHEHWSVREKSRGVLGFGQKPVWLELVAEHANSRLLDVAFLQRAHAELAAPLLAVALPVRGVLWARAAGKDDAGFVAAVRAAFTDVPKGLEAVCAHVFVVDAGKVTGAIHPAGAEELAPRSGWPWPVRG